ILKAHLFIEFELEQILKSNLINPQFLKWDHMKYSQKENLIFAMALVPLEERNVIHGINQIRNKLAHNLEYEINEEELESKIISQFSSRAKIFYEATLSHFNKKYGEGLMSKLQCALFTIWEFLIEIRIIPDDLRKQLNSELKSKGR
ncbi:hypothetical protein V7127_21595, partial [Bacillus sp. JJ1773]|uniref:hypothetical protein n=1 Tax=Bacillus sp. JJ1773 TaxID=3122965 RepID=UPI002FFF0596